MTHPLVSLAVVLVACAAATPSELECGARRIALGQALAQAVGDKRGIRRYGACLLPMDESLVRAALDLSGRPFLVWKVEFPTEKIGSFDTELVKSHLVHLTGHDIVVDGRHAQPTPSCELHR